MGTSLEIPSGSSLLKDENNLYYCLHNIGDIKHPNYTSLDKIEDLDCLCFDDVYLNVYENWRHLRGKDIILFVIGEMAGYDNEWDLKNVPRLEQHCGWYEIEKMVNDGAKLGWHTKTHRDLTKLTDEEIIAECTPLFPMDYFAYPYGKYDDRVMAIVKSLGYKKAFAVRRGGTCEFDITRKLIYNK